MVMALSSGTHYKLQQIAGTTILFGILKYGLSSEISLPKEQTANPIIRQCTILLLYIDFLNHVFERSCDFLFSLVCLNRGDPEICEIE